MSRRGNESLLENNNQYYNYENGNKKIELHFNNLGMLHSSIGPAYIEYYMNGKTKFECYYVNGCITGKEDNPAAKIYYNNGKIQCAQYYLNGLKHRENGPQTICYDTNGKIIKMLYRINGENLTPFYNLLINNDDKLIINKINQTKKINELLTIKIFLLEHNYRSEIVNMVDSKILIIKLS